MDFQDGFNLLEDVAGDKALTMVHGPPKNTAQSFGTSDKKPKKRISSILKKASESDDRPALRVGLKVDFFPSEGTIDTLFY
jgi:hypothetical protein